MRIARVLPAHQRDGPAARGAAGRSEIVQSEKRIGVAVLGAFPSRRGESEFGCEPRSEGRPKFAAGVDHWRPMQCTRRANSHVPIPPLDFPTIRGTIRTACAKMEILTSPFPFFSPKSVGTVVPSSTGFRLTRLRELVTNGMKQGEAATPLNSQRRRTVPRPREARPAEPNPCLRG